MGVGVDGRVFPLPVYALSISAIFCLNNSFSTAAIFWYPHSTSLSSPPHPLGPFSLPHSHFVQMPMACGGGGNPTEDDPLPSWSQSLPSQSGLLPLLWSLLPCKCQWMPVPLSQRLPSFFCRRHLLIGPLFRRSRLCHTLPFGGSGGSVGGRVVGLGHQRASGCCGGGDGSNCKGDTIASASLQSPPPCQEMIPISYAYFQIILQTLFRFAL
jgi:hypothetical protein